MKATARAMYGSSFATASGTVRSSALIRASNSGTSSVSRSIVRGLRCSVASRANSSKRARSSMTLLRKGDTAREDATRPKAAASCCAAHAFRGARGGQPLTSALTLVSEGSAVMTVTPSHTLDATPGDFALAAGFRSAATACGLKPSGNLDLGMVWSDGPCSAAGVFTTNRVLAAPVHVCLDTLAVAAGRVRGVLYNSGCANAVTGERGIADARRMRELGADAIAAKPEELFVLSTGVIGKFLDMEKLARGVTTLRSHS